jgi:hypothetical protein
MLRGLTLCISYTNRRFGDYHAGSILLLVSLLDSVYSPEDGGDFLLQPIMISPIPTEL